MKAQGVFRSLHPSSAQPCSSAIVHQQILLSPCSAHSQLLPFTPFPSGDPLSLALLLISEYVTDSRIKMRFASGGWARSALLAV